MKFCNTDSTGNITATAFHRSPRVTPLPETFYFNNVLQNWNSTQRLFETQTVSRMEKAGPFDCCWSLPSVSGIAAVSLLVSGLHGGHFSTFCEGFIVHRVALMLSKFLQLFDCFVSRQSATCLKRFTRYGHYIDEVQDNHRQTRSCFLSLCAND